MRGESGRMRPENARASLSALRRPRQLALGVLRENRGRAATVRDLRGFEVDFGAIDLDLDLDLAFAFDFVIALAFDRDLDIDLGSRPLRMDPDRRPRRQRARQHAVPPCGELWPGPAKEPRRVDLGEVDASVAARLTEAVVPIGTVQRISVL